MEHLEKNSDDWTETNSTQFIKFGECFTPDRETQFDIILSLLPSSSPLWVADLCAGSGDLADHLLRHRSDLRIRAYDKSGVMLNNLASRFSEFRDRTEINSFDLVDTDWRPQLSSFDCVVSTLAVHHLTNEEKKTLFSDVRRHIKRNGRFILGDLIEPASSVSKDSYAKQWDRAVARASARLFGDDRGFKEFQDLEWNHYSDPNPDPIDKPAQLLEQLEWLREAGFNNVDVHWLHAGHTIISGDA